MKNEPEHAMTASKNIIYVFPTASTFIMRDIEILGEGYSVKPYLFDVRKKWMVPFEFIKQLFFLMLKLPKADVVICHFAGYASFLPALMCRMLGKPCFVVVAGTDGSKFPDFNYGNFVRNPLGLFTGWSLQLCTHVAPVHESLYFQHYDYYEGGQPAQGYSYFFPKAASTPYTPVYYGYDTDFFRPAPDMERNPDSFITIGGLNDSKTLKRKGFDLIIELAKLRPELSFTLVGWDGRQLIPVPENVKLLRYMDLPNVVKALSAHEFYFQLSIMEGFPNALAEAMLCECIPIGSNVSGIPFIIGDAGHILKTRDLEALNQLVDNALADPRRNERPALARKRIVDNFTYGHRKEMFDRLIEKYTAAR